jgi:hypothetical protein
VKVTQNAWFPVLDGPEHPHDPPHLTLNQSQNHLWTEFWFYAKINPYKVGLMAQQLYHLQHFVPSRDTASYTPV